jgi:hypothetical protein
MNRIISTLALSMMILFLSGCYHAQVTTGLEPSAQVYEETFASAWIYGLVPPSVIRAQDECTNGVARVETRLSFVNMLVGNLTLGIYTPMHIKVTCAASQSGIIKLEDSNMVRVEPKESAEIVHQAFAAAAEESRKSKKPVYIDFR